MGNAPQGARDDREKESNDNQLHACHPLDTLDR